MSSIFEILSLDAPIEIVDVGANPIDGTPPYAPLLDAGVGRLTGFEPQPAALAALLEAKGPLETYLPYALGNGEPIDLNISMSSGMTSGLRPDQNTLRLFSMLERVSKIIHTETVDTKKIDNVNEIKRIDYFKIDVQGMELEIIKNGLSKLSDCAIIHIEVSFLPLYKNQPTFGEVDVFMRSQGFIPHCFAAVKNWIIAPCTINGNDRASLNQLLEADVVYAKDFTDAGNASNTILKNIAMIAHCCYNSFDLAMHCIQMLENRAAIEAGSLQAYVESLAS